MVAGHPIENRALAGPDARTGQRPVNGIVAPRVSAFAEVLERVGAFRTIQIRHLETAKDGGQDDLVLLSGTPGAPARDPAEILDPSGRRVVLVLTDGVSDAWQREQLYSVLGRWGRTMPVSIVHLLPRWLWGRCGLNPRKALLKAPGPVAPNGRWSFDLTEAWLEPDPVVPVGSIPVPLLEMRPRALAWWAGLTTGRHAAATEGTVVLTADPARHVALEDPAPEPSPAERVHRFRSVASPLAMRLAQLPAAVPVHLDVAKLISEHFVPDAGPEHLLELLVSGIVYLPGTQGREVHLGHRWGLRFSRGSPGNAAQRCTSVGDRGCREGGGHSPG